MICCLVGTSQRWTTNHSTVVAITPPDRDQSLNHIQITASALSHSIQHPTAGELTPMTRSGNHQQIIRAATLQATDMHITRGEIKCRNTWPPDIVQALKRTCQYHAKWKQEGRPGPQHRVSVLWRQASRLLRTSQRRHTTLKREMKYRKVMDAEVNDQRLFYRLIREHQSSLLGAKVMRDGDLLLTKTRWTQQTHGQCTMPNSQP